MTRMVVQLGTGHAGEQVVRLQMPDAGREVVLTVPGSLTAEDLIGVLQREMGDQARRAPAVAADLPCSSGPV